MGVRYADRLAAADCDCHPTHHHDTLTRLAALEAHVVQLDALLLRARAAIEVLMRDREARRRAAKGGAP